MVRSREQTAAFHARLAGYAGLAPLVVPLLVMWWQPSAAEPAITVQHTYAALILSFLGGIYWGIALAKQTGAWIWLSALPSLWAWPALLMGPFSATWMLMMGFALMLLLDWEARQRGWIRRWFYQLRLTLSAVAIVSLLLGLVG
ncbi:DUF3429 domain-containing protein [Guyparkeria hydrothermalis]|uniref:DUF3429 domain-containing protein n=1 Tax=Guyparkeria hydrothermalis TaxID=923 RepID=UPI002020421D|nr:DUF3429 domain-containing protein [Guyparkeria hydrothermalis]MCL7743555.1 DUF3429 domain-containing protein [Guyparkeria hydrothermalis]